MNKMQQRKKWITFGAILAASIAAAYFFTNGKLFSSSRYFFIGTAWSLAIWMTQSYGNGYINKLIDRRLSWLTQPVWRFVATLVSVSVYSMFAFVAVDALFTFLVSGKPGYWDPERGLVLDAVVKSGRIALVISLVITFTLTAIGFLRAWRESVLQAERLEKEVYRQRYMALRNQVSPHFLFNSFNVLSELVVEDQKLAVRFIRQLSLVYRYVLDSRERDVVPLNEELEFAESYLFLLSIRFEDKIRTHIFRGEGVDGWLVPMSLQLLLENVVKHNVLSAQHPVEIRIRVESDRLVVTNTRTEAPGNRENSTGLGLTYLADRYKMLGHTLHIVETEQAFEVSIPLLQTAEL